MGSKKIIIDTDPGTDDALALLIASNSNELEILGVTTVGGNANICDTTRNTLSMLDYIGSRVEVYKGATNPLSGTFQYAYHIHGKNGLDVGLPSPTSVAQTKSAEEYIADISKNYPQFVTIVALGPLTNIAKVIGSHNSESENIKEIIVMGGAVNVSGNVTQFAEFNIYSDPHAAKVVIDSGIPITLIGLDVTNQISVIKDDMPWPGGSTKISNLATCLISSGLSMPSLKSVYHLHDPLVIAAIVMPDLLQFEEFKLDVILDGPERGRTIKKNEGRSVSVAIDVNVPSAKELIKSRLI